MPHGVPYKYDPRLPDQLRLHAVTISSSSGFVPMFENGANDSRFLGVMVRLIPHLRGRPVVATIRGGHVESAVRGRRPPRDGARAGARVREEGHHTGLVVTPQNRFGQQASALPGRVVHRRRAGPRGAQGRSGDQPAVPRLRGAASQSRVVAEPPHARVLRPVGPVQLAPVVEAARSRSAPAARSSIASMRTCCRRCSGAS